MLLDAERIADCRVNLLSFASEMFKARKGSEFISNWHHIEICNMLERVVLGDIRRLIINVPPRYSKTELAVVNFISWCMGNFTDCEFIHASYSKRLATNNTWNARTVMTHERYAEIFEPPIFMSDSNAKDEYRTAQGGCVYATGSDGTITGYGAGKMRNYFAGAIIVDDPHKAGEATSDIMRQNVIDWFSTTLESRTNSPDTPIIVIMQRLHQEDLSGWLLSGGNGEHWDLLKIPAINEDGSPLWGFKHDIPALDRLKNANPYVFAGQYMQEPAPKEGGMIKLHWFAQSRFKTLPAASIRIVQSWDTAFKTKEINDPTVCTTWLEAITGYYLIECFVFRGDYPAVKRNIKSKYAEFTPDAVLIEDKASGQSLIQDLRQETGIPIIAIMPVGDKETRMYAASSLIESGRVWLPESAPWLPAYEAELLMFPMAKHDDQVDSTSQFLNWVKKPQEILIG